MNGFSESPSKESRLRVNVIGAATHSTPVADETILLAKTSGSFISTLSVMADSIDIEEVAISCGMKTLQQYCLEHIIHGETPISEFVRVLGVVSD